MPLSVAAAPSGLKISALTNSESLVREEEVVRGGGLLVGRKMLQLTAKFQEVRLCSVKLVSIGVGQNCG